MVTYDCLIDSIVILVVVFEDMRYHMHHSNWVVWILKYSMHTGLLGWKQNSSTY